MSPAKLRVLSVIGTRPEAIKMAPVIAELRSRPDLFESQTCVTAQHRDMLDQVLELFAINPDFDLDIMKAGQSLFDVMTGALDGLNKVLDTVRPDIVLAQGDTTTTFIASLAASMHRSAVGHIEAGLRTHNKYSPFPEEINRRLTSVLADWHFPPTEGARQNLLRENIADANILVTGNTVIDALLATADKPCDFDAPPFNLLDQSKKLILVTAHRRESFGEPFEQICYALAELAAANEDIEFVYPVHPNPNVREPAHRILGAIDRVHLVAPLDYFKFVHLMKRSYIILTDSGGIQEEAPSLGKPVLVMRESTERPEGALAGSVKLVGTNKEAIVAETQLLLKSKEDYERMTNAGNPYGDGTAARRIVDFLYEKGSARE